VEVELQRVEAAQRDVLANLLQLYCHDFSEILGQQLGDDGRFATPTLDAYWTDPRREVFFIRVDGKLAGFARVRRGSRLSSDTEVWDMEEFFVVRAHRRSGVGTKAAHQVFADHPGRWEVRQRRENSAATAFWRKAIGAYREFREEAFDDDRWRGAAQFFVS
jgi:predicted acetyltransferase